MTHPTEIRALRYRAASYHAAHVEPGTLQRAAMLGFNTVELQLEGDTMRGFEKLRRRADETGMFREIRDLGMEVAVWTHELSGYDAAAHGPVEVANAGVWAFVRSRYRRVCRELLPEMDYLVLTVVETQHNMTEPGVLQRLVEAIDSEVRAAGKRLIFRSFVWHPQEMEQVVAAMKRMPEDVWFHTKYVPQDWHFRSIDNPLIGRFPGRVEIVEYGVAGEYIRERHLATCVADDLMQRHRTWLEKGVDGVSVRVNRWAGGDSNSAFDSLQESNLWVLAPLAAGRATTLEAGLSAYAEDRFGTAAAPAAAAALRTSGAVNMEALCVERETFGDPRSAVPAGSTLDLPARIAGLRERWRQRIDIPAGLDLDTAAARAYADDEDFLGRNPFHNHWAVFRWAPRFAPAYHKIRRGVPAVIARKEAAYAEARRVAIESLSTVEAAEALFDDPEAYRFLHWRLSENLWHLDVMCAAALAWLNAARSLYAEDAAEREARRRQARDWLGRVEQLDASARDETVSITWLGRRRTLQRGGYLDLERFVARFRTLWRLPTSLKAKDGNSPDAPRRGATPFRRRPPRRC
ncbi:MAG: hypothetical protein ACOC8F_00475 [Planctomycetota bacterium]